MVGSDGLVSGSGAQYWSVLRLRNNLCGRSAGVAHERVKSRLVEVLTFLCVLLNLGTLGNSLDVACVVFEDSYLALYFNIMCLL